MVNLFKISLSTRRNSTCLKTGAAKPVVKSILEVWEATSSCFLGKSLSDSRGSFNQSVRGKTRSKVKLEKFCVEIRCTFLRG